MAKPRKYKKSPLERAIDIHKLVIRRHEEKIQSIREQADEDIAKIRRKISIKKILIDALEKGALKP